MKENDNKVIPFNKVQTIRFKSMEDIIKTNRNKRKLRYNYIMEKINAILKDS